MMIGVVVVVVVRVVLLPPTILPLAPGGMHGPVSLYYTKLYTREVAVISLSRRPVYR